jgi:beta-mannanase
MKPMDNWLTGLTGGQSTSIFGTFLTLNLTDANAKSNVEDPLTLMWNSGYTPFVNLPALSGDKAYDVASGKYDAMITTWAKSFKNYANGGARFAYLAPLQEMNGEWVSYGGDPPNFILAFKRFRTIFAQQGVPSKSVKWVFAPNGWSKPGLPTFEAYYPGDAFVDVVAISAYNFGYCQGGRWEEPETVFNNPNITNGHYLDRMRALAPTKPIFIAQTASSSYRTSGSSNAAEKERWLRDAYKYLSTQPQVRAVIYFNLIKECDWAVFIPSKIQNPGYKTGVNSNGYNYISPTALIAIDHSFH